MRDVRVFVSKFFGMVSPLRLAQRPGPIRCFLRRLRLFMELCEGNILPSILRKYTKRMNPMIRQKDYAFNWAPYKAETGCSFPCRWIMFRKKAATKAKRRGKGRCRKKQRCCSSNKSRQRLPPIVRSNMCCSLNIRTKSRMSKADYCIVGFLTSIYAGSWTIFIVRNYPIIWSQNLKSESPARTRRIALRKGCYTALTCTA